MKRTFQRMLIILAAVGFVGSAYVYDVQAQDPGGDLGVGGDTTEGEDTGDTTSTGGELSTEDQNFVTIASYVSCYNERIPDVNEANLAIEFYLSELNMTLTDYKTKVDQYSENEDVQAAIDKEKKKCATYVLPMPPADWQPDDGTGETVETTEDKEPSLDIKGKKYKGSGGSFSIVVSMKTNKKGSASVTGGTGQSTSMGGSSKRDGDEIRFSVSSGKNSGTLSCDFEDKKVDEEDNTYEWDELDCSFSGTVNGKPVSFSADLD